MTFSLENDVKSGKEYLPPRILLYSPQKVGKSTFAAGFKNHLIVNFDNSQEKIEGEKTKQITTSRDALDVLCELCTKEHNYKVLAFDTIDWLEQIICQEIADDTGKKTIEEIKWAVGYPLLVKKWQFFIKGFEKLRTEKGMTILLTCHATVKTYIPPGADEYHVYAPKLYGKINKTNTSQSLILEYVDTILFGNDKIITKNVDGAAGERKVPVANSGRVLYTSNHPASMAGNRDSLSPEIPFTTEAFINDYYEKTGHDIFHRNENKTGEKK